MKNLSWLSGLRWLAAIIVVLYHLNQQRSTVWLTQLSWDIYQFTEHLVFVVSIFFMFTAFFRSLWYWRYFLYAEWKRPVFFSALFDRITRIAPLYYFALFMSIVVVLCIQWYDASIFPRLLSGLTFSTWISAYTFFPVDLNGPLWFVSYDIAGWIIISLALHGMLYIRRKIWVLWYFFMIGSLLVFLHLLWIDISWSLVPWIAGQWFPTYNPFLFWLHFLFGALAWFFVVLFEKKKNLPLYVFEWLSLVTLVILWVFLWQIRAAWDWDVSIPTWPYHFPYITILLVILFITLPFTRYMSAWFDNRVFLFLSYISYPLYLFHALIIVLLRTYVFPGVQLMGYDWMIFSLLTLSISVVFSYWVQLFSDRKK